MASERVAKNGLAECKCCVQLTAHIRIDMVYHRQLVVNHLNDNLEFVLRRKRDQRGPYHGLIYFRHAAGHSLGYCSKSVTVSRGLQREFDEARGYKLRYLNSDK